MSDQYSNNEIIDFSLGFDYAYSKYQMDSYVVDTNITSPVCLLNTTVL